MPAKKIALIIHAGAGSRPKNLERAEKIRRKLTELCEEGHRFLENRSATETVTQVVKWLEDWPETNAGTGSLLQSDGQARLSASLMDGHSRTFSGVINIEKIKNPILIAQLLQKEKDRVLSGREAKLYALEKGFKTAEPRTKESIQRWKQATKSGKYGTVGACALDADGHLASATSTGGRGMERPGRVSDSATPSGNYANDYAACSATGVGEEIMDESLCTRLVLAGKEWLDLGKSFDQTFKEMRARKRQLAAIGVDLKARAFWNHTTDILYYSLKTPYKSSSFEI